MGNVIPKPAAAYPAGGEFTFHETTIIYVEPADVELLAIGEYLAGKLRAATGFPLLVVGTPPATGEDYLRLSTDGDANLGEEGYQLVIYPSCVQLTAHRPVGLFRGIQTIRQLLPAQADSPTLQAATWNMPTGTIRDVPRYAWRGAMLDVSRHFFSLDDVKTYIDLLAYYKINVLHLHLSDDQGWRIEIKSWPRLATYGGSTQVGGGDGGYYTQADYADLIAYAQARYLTIVPEIDTPGHTNAALASYPELNCDGEAPALYSGTAVGFSSFCIDKDLTYQFLDDVIGELAALTPGPYIHIGGDEAHSTPKDAYVKFIEKIQAIVQAHGKQVVGWEEIGQANLLPGTVAQHWNIIPELSYYSQAAALQGAKIVISPADRSYLDMKYDTDSPLGLDWAGTTTTRASYGWDPAGRLLGVGDDSILGVEAPLWSETLETLRDVEYLAFPRILGIAEIGWSPAGLSWEEYRLRLGMQGKRLEGLGVNFYRDPEVEWKN